MSVGEKIKLRRKELGLSAEEVAEQLGVSPATIYRYESNYINNMGVDKLKPIAKVLRVSEAYLMGWETSDTIILAEDETSIINAYRNADSLTRDMVKRCLGISTIDDTDETVNKIVRKVSRKKDSNIPAAK